MQNTRPRSKELSSAELQSLRNEPQFLYLNEKEFILYNLVDKESNTGIFKNERLLILNVRRQSLSYLSKIPSGLVPFYTEDEVENQMAKQKISQSEVHEGGLNKFECKQLEDKNCIEIRLNSKDKKVEWVFFYKGKAIMKEWFRHINFIFTKSSQEVSDKYHFLPPLNQPSKIKSVSQEHPQQPLNNKDQSAEKHEGPEQKEKEKLKIQNMLVHEKYNQQQKQASKKSEKSQHKQDNKQQLSLNFQSVQRIQKDSEFNEFIGDSPLGSFVRNNQNRRQFQTSPLPDDQKPSVAYISHSPTDKHNLALDAPYSKSQVNNSLLNFLKDSNARPINISQNNKEMSKHKSSSIKNADIKYQSSSINYKTQNWNSEVGGSETVKLGSIRKNKFEMALEYPKQDLVSFSNSNSIKKVQSDSVNPPIYKSTKQNQVSTQWNKMYYSEQDNQPSVYFSFINQCSAYFQSIVDELPLTRAITTFDRQRNYYYKTNNGIEYIIAYENCKQESLIYELSENTPVVFNNYQIYDNLKRSFFQEKEMFFKNSDENPSLIVLIQFKGVMAFCRALNRTEEMYEKSNKQIIQTDFEQSLLNKIESMEIHITSSTDFRSMMRKANISEINWNYLYSNTKSKCYKRIFLNQMLSEVFQNIIRNQLCHLYQKFPGDQLEQISLNIVNNVVLDCVLKMINRLFGRGHETDILWDVLFKQTERRFSIKPKIQNVLQGYLLYSITIKIGLDFIDDIKLSSKLGINQKQNRVDKSYIKGFKPSIYCLNYEQMSANLRKIVQNLELKTTESNNQQLQLLVDSEIEQIPEQINYLQPQIHLKFSSTHPYMRDNIEQNDIYSVLSVDKPSYEHYQIIVSAVKWSLKNNEISHAEDITFLQIQQILFWIGKIPLISHFYDAIADNYIKSGEFELGMQWINKSIDNLTDVFDSNDLSVLERRYILAELNLQINHRQQSLKQLYECKRICEDGNINHSIYMDTLIKISKLTLSLSKFNDSVNNSLECLKHLQKIAEEDNKFENVESATQFLAVSQLLLRSFELTNRRQELYQIGHLCLQRCQNVNSIKVYKKMFKIFLFPYLKRLNLNESQCLLVLVQQLDTIYKESNYTQEYLYECMKDKKILLQMDKRISVYFKSICSLYDEIIKRRILQQFHQRLSEYLKIQRIRNDPIVFTSELFLMVNLIGVSFIQALLKDVYYD